jgi:UDP-N-acetylmuramoylalanine--D-glutamate ligase
MDLLGKRILIVGMARSGMASAAFLAKRGARVKVTDKRAAAELSSEIELLEGLGAEAEAGGHVLESFLAAELVVASPGVPLRLAELEKARLAGVEVISEIELASRFLQGRIIEPLVLRCRWAATSAHR